MKGFRTIGILGAIMLMAIATFFGFEVPASLLVSTLEFLGVDGADPEQIAAAASAVIVTIAAVLRAITTSPIFKERGFAQIRALAILATLSTMLSLSSCQFVKTQIEGTGEVLEATANITCETSIAANVDSWFWNMWRAVVPFGGDAENSCEPT